MRRHAWDSLSCRRSTFPTAAAGAPRAITSPSPSARSSPRGRSQGRADDRRRSAMKRSELGSIIGRSLTVALTLSATALLIAPKAYAGGKQVTSTTPPGITLIEVMRDLPISEPQVLWLRPGDADGRTLFVYAQDG